MFRYLDGGEGGGAEGNKKKLQMRTFSTVLDFQPKNGMYNCLEVPEAWCLTFWKLNLGEIRSTQIILYYDLVHLLYNPEFHFTSDGENPCSFIQCTGVLFSVSERTVLLFFEDVLTYIATAKKGIYLQWHLF